MSRSDPRLLIVDLCRQLHARGWAPAASGGASVRHEGRIFVAPGGVARDQLSADQVLELNLDGRLVDAKSASAEVAQSVLLYMNAYRLKSAGAVVRSQSVAAVMAGLGPDGGWAATQLDLLGQLRGVRYHDLHTVPIIEGASRDLDLADPMADAMLAHPAAHAVLVRRQGAFYWGRDFEEAKRHAECYEQLFEITLKMRQLGIDPTKQPT